MFLPLRNESADVRGFMAVMIYHFACVTRTAVVLEEAFVTAGLLHECHV